MHMNVIEELKEIPAYELLVQILESKPHSDADISNLIMYVRNEALCGNWSAYNKLGYQDRKDFKEKSKHIINRLAFGVD